MKKSIVGRYVFAFLTVIAGILLDQFNVGREFLGFSSVGSWLVFVGFIMLAIITLNVISGKRRKIDERMTYLALKSSRITFVLLIFAAFIVMIIDGIRPIDVPYHLFMSYLIAYLMLAYFVVYKILEWKS